MAAQQDRFCAYPHEVRSSTQQPSVVYTRLPDHYALHRQSSDSPPSKDAVTVVSGDGALIEVFQGKADKRKRAVPSAKVGPVYALQADGTPAVPTGRVFIRFQEGVRVEERQQEIAQAGYEIVQSLGYAPHAAWLHARSGEIADALTKIPGLEKIAGVENVEPQMLTPRASRSMTAGQL